jgi:hypothetical protein
VKTFANRDHVAEVLERLRHLRPDSPRRWGRMSSHQMICHLCDAFIMGTAEKPVSMHGGVVRQTCMRLIALYVPFRWPAGIPTRPELDQYLGGTVPVAFDDDLATLQSLIERAAASPDFFAGRCHPSLGRMSHAAWLRWSYLHVDHHLRQFGN